MGALRFSEVQYGSLKYNDLETTFLIKGYGHSRLTCKILVQMIYSLPLALAASITEGSWVKAVAVTLKHASMSKVKVISELYVKCSSRLCIKGISP